MTMGDSSSNSWASLQGLMTQLALPMVRSADGLSFVKRQYEVFINDKWEVIDQVVIDEHGVTFSRGEIKRWCFQFKAECPIWREHSPTSPFHGFRP